MDVRSYKLLSSKSLNALSIVYKGSGTLQYRQGGTGVQVQTQDGLTHCARKMTVLRLKFIP